MPRFCSRDTMGTIFWIGFTMELCLTSAALDYLSKFILALLITGYFVVRLCVGLLVTLVWGDVPGTFRKCQARDVWAICDTRQPSETAS